MKFLRMKPCLLLYSPNFQCLSSELSTCFQVLELDKEETILGFLPNMVSGLYKLKYDVSGSITIITY